MATRKSKSGSKWYVSRQCYWGTNEDSRYVVEVALGGSNYAGADELVPKWPKLGEGKEFLDPCEAVEAAIAVCEAWKMVQPLATVAMGATGGGTTPFEPDSYQSLRMRAEKLKEQLPTCDQCGQPLPPSKECYSNFDGDEVFCCESCAEVYAAACRVLNEVVDE